MALAIAFRFFSAHAEWQDWQPAISGKIDELVKAISREPFKGPGNPEPLKHSLKGCWSRRITDEHRLVYRIMDRRIEILSAGDIIQPEVP